MAVSTYCQLANQYLNNIPTADRMIQVRDYLLVNHTGNNNNNTVMQRLDNSKQCWREVHASVIQRTKFFFMMLNGKW